jgi:AcrR family transcriptional regulator
VSRKPKRPFANRRTKSAARNPRKEPRQSRAKATVEAIQEAALQVLDDVGYEKLTTTRVAARAGVSVGTLYQYYGNKDSLVRALVVAYLDRAERAMKAVLEENTSLPTLARHFVLRFIAFKLEGGERGEALRSVFVSGNGQMIANKAIASVVATLAQRIRVSKPRWPEARVTQVANMWPSLVFGATSAMLERAPELVAEPWFGESLEHAVIALFRE